MSLWNNWPVKEPRELIGSVFRVKSFDRNGTTVDDSGSVHSKSRFRPYGFLDVASPTSHKLLRIPIIHRDDYLLATFFFDDPKLTELKDKEQIELLLTYVPADTDKHGFSTSPLHCLHYCISRFGTIDKYYSSPDLDPRIIFGDFTFTGELSVMSNLDPAI